MSNLSDVKLMFQDYLKRRIFLNALLRGRYDFYYDHMIFQMSDLPRSKAVNLMLNRLDRHLRLLRPYSYPNAIQLEPTTACQLECPLCPRQVVVNGKNGEHMSWDVYEAVINEIGPTTLAIAFWQWGEPLLHPRIIDMIGLAHKFHTLSFLSTNGQTEAGPDFLSNLFRAGLDLLLVSLDGMTPDGYSSFRQGGLVEKTIRFIEHAVAAKKQLKSPLPIINVRTVVTRGNEHEVDEIRKFVSSVGADMYSIKSVSLYYDDDPNNIDLPQNKEYRSFQYQGQQEATDYRQMPNYCIKPWSWPTLLHDGTLLACECDHAQEWSLGNIFSEGPFRKVWRSDKASSVRRRFSKSGEIDTDFCRRCRYKIDDAIRAVSVFNE